MCSPSLSRGLAGEQLGGEALLKQAEDATLLEGGEEMPLPSPALAGVLHRQCAASTHPDAPPLAAAQLWPAERWWERSGWEEAAVLLAGLYSDDCTPVLRWLRDAQPEVAAQCVLESGAAIADREALFRELHDAWLPRLTDIEREPPPRPAPPSAARWAGSGSTTARASGSRPTACRTSIGSQIPGGEFIYQEGERRTLRAFRIARYPITHAQFQAFLDAEDGYGDDRWWAGLGPIRTATPSSPAGPSQSSARDGELVRGHGLLRLAEPSARTSSWPAGSAADRVGVGAGGARAPTAVRIPGVASTGWTRQHRRDPRRRGTARPGPDQRRRHLPARAPRPRASWTSPATSGNGA